MWHRLLRLFRHVVSDISKPWSCDYDGLWQEEARPVPEEVDEQTHLPDPDEFVAPAPPPSYFSTFYSYTPRLARR